MSKKEELIIKQEQLQRLAEEGKPVCQVLYEAKEETKQAIENEINNEAQTPLIDKADLGTGLGQDIEGGQNLPEKPKRIPISRESFILEVEGQLDHWRQIDLNARLKILKLENTLRKVYELEDLGLSVRFYEVEDGLRFEAREKGRFGFQAKIPNSVEDAGLWQQLTKEREAKKNDSPK